MHLGPDINNLVYQCFVPELSDEERISKIYNLICTYNLTNNPNFSIVALGADRVNPIVVNRVIINLKDILNRAFIKNVNLNGLQVDSISADDLFKALLQNQNNAYDSLNLSDTGILFDINKLKALVVLFEEDDDLSTKKLIIGDLKPYQAQGEDKPGELGNEIYKLAFSVNATEICLTHSINLPEFMIFIAKLPGSKVRKLEYAADLAALSLEQTQQLAEMLRKTGMVEFKFNSSDVKKQMIINKAILFNNAMVECFVTSKDEAALNQLITLAKEDNIQHFSSSIFLAHPNFHQINANKFLKLLNTLFLNTNIKSASLYENILFNNYLHPVTNAEIAATFKNVKLDHLYIIEYVNNIDFDKLYSFKGINAKINNIHFDAHFQLCHYPDANAIAEMAKNCDSNAIYLNKINLYARDLITLINALAGSKVLKVEFDKDFKAFPVEQINSLAEVLNKSMLAEFNFVSSNPGYTDIINQAMANNQYYNLMHTASHQLFDHLPDSLIEMVFNYTIGGKYFKPPVATPLTIKPEKSSISSLYQRKKQKKSPAAEVVKGPQP